MEQPEAYEIVVRVAVRRARDGKQISAAVSAFDVDHAPSVEQLCEAALEATRLRALGTGGATALRARAAVAIRELARNESVRRGIAVGLAAIRQLADQAEHRALEAAARVVHEIRPGADEDG